MAQKVPRIKSKVALVVDLPPRSVHGDRADRVKVRLGAAGVDAVEVLDGLREGDEVIVSDMQDYEHVETVNLR